MGQLTRAALVSQGLLVSGRNDITTVANIDLNAKLRELYGSWPWPFLHRKLDGFAIAKGTQSIQFGVGAAGGPALEVQKIISPLFIYTSDYSYRGKCYVRGAFGGELNENETINDPSKFIGAPFEAKVMPDSTVWGKWTLWFTPVPERDYLAQVNYIEQPADIDTSSGGDNTKPIYPNDETLIRIALCLGLEYGKKYDELQTQQEVLRNKILQDRIRYGQVPGINDNIGLDPRTFRTGSPVRNGWWF